MCDNLRPGHAIRAQGNPRRNSVGGIVLGGILVAPIRERHLAECRPPAAVLPGPDAPGVPVGQAGDRSRLRDATAWTMPIKGRVDMLTTGVRTPAGVKVLGSDPQMLAASASRSRPRAASSPSAPETVPSSTSYGTASAGRTTA